MSSVVVCVVSKALLKMCSGVFRFQLKTRMSWCVGEPSLAGRFCCGTNKNWDWGRSSVLRFLTFWFLGDYNNDLGLRIINHQGLTMIIEFFDWHLQWQQCLNKEICFFKHPTSVSPLRRAGWLFLTRWMKFQVESNHHPAKPRCSIFPHRPHWPADNHRLHHL